MLRFIQVFPLITTRICLTYDFNIYVMFILQEDSSVCVAESGVAYKGRDNCFGECVVWGEGLKKGKCPATKKK